MAKFCGIIGYKEMVETAPGVWDPQVSERLQYGDVLQATSRTQTVDSVNDDIRLSNRISIVADPYAKNNFHNMLFVIYMGTKWKVESVDVKYPRLILSMGGVYNG